MEQLVLTLQQAMQPDDAVRKPAEAALKQFENSPGYLQALAGIMGTAGGDVNVRMMAVICAKNVVSRCWKPRGHQSARMVTDEEKQQLRAMLVEPQRYEEAVPLVAAQFAMLVARRLPILPHGIDGDDNRVEPIIARILREVRA